MMLEDLLPPSFSVATSSSRSSHTKKTKSVHPRKESEPDATFNNIQHIQDVFKINQVHVKLLSSDQADIMRGDNSGSLLGSMLNALSVCPAHKHHTVIQESVPRMIEDNCALLLYFLSEIFNEANSLFKERLESDQTHHEDGIHPQFYKTLIDVVDEAIWNDHSRRYDSEHGPESGLWADIEQAKLATSTQNQCNTKSCKTTSDASSVKLMPDNVSRLLVAIKEVALLAVSGDTRQSHICQRLWTIVIEQLLSHLTGGAMVRNGDRTDLISSTCHTSDSQELGFHVTRDGSRRYVSCNPDCTVKVNHVVRCHCATRAAVDYPAVVVQVSADSSSSDADDSLRSLMNSEHKRGTSKPQHEPRYTQTSSDTSSNPTSNNLPNPDHWTPLNCEHLIQLLSCLKTSIKKLGAASKPLGDYIEKPIRAHGLFVVQNRIHLTCLYLDVKPYTSASYFEMGNFVCRVGNVDAMDGCSWLYDTQDIVKGFNLKYVTSEDYLDMFNPTHLSALLDYLKIVIFHDQKCQIP